MALWLRPEETSSYKLSKVINYGGRSIVYKGVVNGERVIIKKTKSNREIEFLCKLRNVSGVVHYKSYFFNDQLYIQCKETFVTLFICIIILQNVMDTLAKP